MIRRNKLTFFLLTNCRCWAIALIAVFTCLCLSQDILAQDFGDGGIDDLTTLQQQAPPTGTTGGGGGGIGGGIGGGDGLDTFSADDADLLSGVTTEDTRNQGFVGATGMAIQDLGFVGPPGETSGPPLTDGASFGGGVNDGQTVGGGLGGGGGGGGGNQRNGFGGFGTDKGFQVLRRGVRTALSPRFAAPTRSSAEISTRFNNHIQRQPGMANDGSGLFVSINNRIATVTGFAQTDAQRSRFMRQLRLEPGIDRVVDQTSGQ